MFRSRLTTNGCQAVVCRQAASSVQTKGNQSNQKQVFDVAPCLCHQFHSVNASNLKQQLTNQYRITLVTGGFRGSLTDH